MRTCTVHFRGTTGLVIAYSQQSYLRISQLQVGESLACLEVSSQLTVRAHAGKNSGKINDLSTASTESSFGQLSTEAKSLRIILDEAWDESIGSPGLDS